MSEKLRPLDKLEVTNSVISTEATSRMERHTEAPRKKSENLVKKTCRELGITQKELAKYFGVTPKAVSDWATNKYDTPKNFQIVVELIKKEKDYEALVKALKI